MSIAISVGVTATAACHYNSPPWRVKRLNHPQGDPVTGSGLYRHSSLSLRQSTLEGEEVEPLPSPPWRVKSLNHPQGDPVTGSGRYRHDIMAGYFSKEAFDITTTIDTRPSSFYISTCVYILINTCVTLVSWLLPSHRSWTLQ
ncbi:hypothetical protein EMCRGX_G005259 [Ephydatia muelleri]